MTTAISSPIRNLSQTRRNHGACATIRWISSRLAEKILRLEVSELLWLDVAALPPSIEIDPEFTFRFLSASEIARFASDPIHNLAHDFVDRAACRNDLCLAAFHGDRLASYSWYARNSVDGQDHVGVPMSYPTDVVYMFNAYTHPEYRGRGLFCLGVAIAAKELAEQGVTKVITTINSTNFASLRSCHRLGFVSLGRIWTVGRGTRRLARTPSAAKRLNISFARR
jgi:hypothetical protein